jgi:phytoene dehydrogenase-like protein
MMRNEYDAIVIGGGVAGLTAAAYLAKAGVKVALVERREKVGGYCGSFTRDGYIFDEAVHYVNNYGRNGILRKICRDLNVEEQLQVLRIDPSDRLLMPGIEILVYSDPSRTIEGLKKLFPRQASPIDRFFDLIQNFSFSTVYVQWHGKSFRELLDAYFSDEKLKTGLSVFASTLGLDSKALSAVAGLAYYKGSIMDGGYHVVGGSQKLADALLKQYLGYGGKVLLEAQVKEILVTNRRVQGIELPDGTKLKGDVVVAACDATQVFTKMLSNGNAVATIGQKVSKMVPSLSNFIVYLGIKGRLDGEIPKCCNLWYFPFSSERKGSFDITKDDGEVSFVHIALSSLHDRSLAPPDGETLVLFAGAQYLSKEYWDTHRNRLADVLIKRADRAIPGLKNRIAVSLPATPHTLYRYTLNRDGAYRGWALTAEQTRWDILPYRTKISGLFMAGHWVTTPVGNGGVSMAAISGRNVAKSVLRALNIMASL